MFELNSLRDLHVLKLAVIQVPASLKMRLACTSGVAERGWRGGACFVDLCLMKVTTQRGFGH